MTQRFTVGAALRAVAGSSDGEYAVLLAHGSMQLGYYKPDTTDRQKPHAQDEVYIVQSGSGTFVVHGEGRPFESGEALFVPAGAEHRFENFTNDFAAWVVFYGPRGGECAG